MNNFLWAFSMSAASKTLDYKSFYPKKRKKIRYKNVFLDIDSRFFVFLRF